MCIIDTRFPCHTTLRAQTPRYTKSHSSIRTKRCPNKMTRRCGLWDIVLLQRRRSQCKTRRPHNPRSLRATGLEALYHVVHTAAIALIHILQHLQRNYETENSGCNKNQNPQTTHVHMATANTRTCTEMKHLPVLDESIRSSLNNLNKRKTAAACLYNYLNHVITHAHYQQWAVLTKSHTRILVASYNL